jgi:hypothetical protein
VPYYVTPKLPEAKSLAVPERVPLSERAEGVKNTLTVVVKVILLPVDEALMSPLVKLVPSQCASHTSQAPGVVDSIAIVTFEPEGTPEENV